MGSEPGTLEEMVMHKKFWKNKKIFLTGHTGFKGSWLSLLLNHLGAKVYGYSIGHPTNPSMFQKLNLESKITSHTIGDIRNYDSLLNAVNQCQPDIIIHMAAQPIVRKSYLDPIETYSTNVMGTVNILSAFKNSDTRVLINVTSDKCYQNNEWVWGYREDDRLGGHDPYSNSKACAELVTSAYQNSFFKLDHNKQLSSVRAGNVIGGGDWAKDRLIPDIYNSIKINKPLKIRNPNSTRPWQHVLEPLRGYMILAKKMYESDNFSGAYNFGPNDIDCRSVNDILNLVKNVRNNDFIWNFENNIENAHEATLLKLDCSKVKNKIGWNPVINLEQTIGMINNWYNHEQDNLDTLYEFTISQIDDYLVKSKT